MDEEEIKQRLASLKKVLAKKQKKLQKIERVKNAKEHVRQTIEQQETAGADISNHREDSKCKNDRSLKKKATVSFDVDPVVLRSPRRHSSVTDADIDQDNVTRIPLNSKTSSTDDLPARMNQDKLGEWRKISGALEPVINSGGHLHDDQSSLSQPNVADRDLATISAMSTSVASPMPGSTRSPLLSTSVARTPSDCNSSQSGGSSLIGADMRYSEEGSLSRRVRKHRLKRPRKSCTAASDSDSSVSTLLSGSGNEIQKQLKLIPHTVVSKDQVSDLATVMNANKHEPNACSVSHSNQQQGDHFQQKISPIGKSEPTRNIQTSSSDHTTGTEGACKESGFEEAELCDIKDWNDSCIIPGTQYKNDSTSSRRRKSHVETKDLSRRRSIAHVPLSRPSKDGSLPCESSLRNHSKKRRQVSDTCDYPVEAKDVAPPAPVSVKQVEGSSCNVDSQNTEDKFQPGDIAFLCENSEEMTLSATPQKRAQKEVSTPITKVSPYRVRDPSPIAKVSPSGGASLPDSTDGRISTKHRSHKKTKKPDVLDFSFLDDDEGGDMYSSVKSRRHRRARHSWAPGDDLSWQKTVAKFSKKQLLCNIAPNDSLFSSNTTEPSPAQSSLSDESYKLFPLPSHIAIKVHESFDLPDDEYAVLKSEKTHGEKALSQEQESAYSADSQMQVGQLDKSVKPAKQLVKKKSKKSKCISRTVVDENVEPLGVKDCSVSEEELTKMENDGDCSQVSQVEIQGTSSSRSNFSESVRSSHKGGRRRKLSLISISSPQQLAQNSPASAVVKRSSLPTCEPLKGGPDRVQSSYEEASKSLRHSHSKVSADSHTRTDEESVAHHVSRNMIDAIDNPPVSHSNSNPSANKIISVDSSQISPSVGNIPLSSSKMEPVVPHRRRGRPRKSSIGSHSSRSVSDSYSQDSERDSQVLLADGDRPLSDVVKTEDVPQTVGLSTDGGISERGGRRGRGRGRGRRGGRGRHSAKVPENQSGHENADDELQTCSDGSKVTCPESALKLQHTIPVGGTGDLKHLCAGHVLQHNAPIQVIAAATESAILLWQVPSGGNTHHHEAGSRGYKLLHSWPISQGSECVSMSLLSQVHHVAVVAVFRSVNDVVIRIFTYTADGVSNSLFIQQHQRLYEHVLLCPLPLYDAVCVSCSDVVEETSHLTKYMLAADMSALLEATICADADEHVHSVIPLKQQPNALLAASQFSAFIWNHQSGALLVKVPLKVPITQLLSGCARKGLVFLVAIGLPSAITLFALNPLTSNCVLLNFLDNSPACTQKNTICGAACGNFLAMLGSGGNIQLFTLKDLTDCLADVESIIGGDSYRILHLGKSGSKISLIAAGTSHLDLYTLTV